ncbi:polysaccharide biosynthesis C-terminal domain-containing protein [Methylophilaceae bacterium Uisw_097]
MLGNLFNKINLNAKITLNTLIQVSEQFISAILSFVILYFFVRAYTPEILSLLSYSESILLISIIINQYGAETIINKEIKESGKVKDTFWNLMYFNWIFLVPSVAFVFLVIFFENNDSIKSILILLPLILFSNSLNIAKNFFLATYNNWINSIVQLFFTFISFLTKIYLLLNDFPFEIYIHVYVLLYFISPVILLILMWKKNLLVLIKPNLSYIKSIFIKATPFFISSLFIILFTRIDMIMIRILSDFDQISFYAIALKIYILFAIIPAIIVSNIYPKFVGIKDMNYFNKLLLNLYRILNIYSITIILLILFFGKFFITFLFGPQYSSSFGILLFLVMALFFSNFFIVTGLIINPIIFNGVKSLKRSILGFLINILLNIFLIPMFGAVGAAAATMISFMIVGLFYESFTSNSMSQFKLKLSSLNFFKYRDLLNEKI